MSNQEQAQERCLAAVAHGLAAAGARAQKLLGADALAARDSSTLAQLVFAVARAERQPDSGQSAAGLLGPASPIPTQCLRFNNMFNPEE